MEVMSMTGGALLAIELAMTTRTHAPSPFGANGWCECGRQCSMKTLRELGESWKMFRWNVAVTSCDAERQLSTTEHERVLLSISYLITSLKLYDSHHVGQGIVALSRSTSSPHASKRKRWLGQCMT